MKLLVLLGAGSSCAQTTPGDPAGERFPLIEGLNKEVIQWAQYYSTVTSTPDYFGRLWRHRLEYNARDPVFADAYSVDFEKVLGDCYSLWNGIRGAPFGDPVFSKAAEALGFKDDDVGFYDAGEQIRDILTKIAARFRRSSRHFEVGTKTMGNSAFVGYLDLFEALSNSFDLAIYNLNYDTTALKALPFPLFTGFDQAGIFQPGDVHDRGQWNFIYHLHGSVHFSFPEVPRDRIEWKHSLTEDEFRDTVDLPTGSADERVRIASTVITGGWKLDQLQAEPFQSYYSTFRRAAYQADAILIGGYSFGDSHINSVITNAIDNRSRKVPILILDKSKRGNAPKIGQIAPPGRHVSPWAKAQTTLRFTGLSRPGPVPASNAPGLEILDDFRAPTAVWTEGFETAATEIEACVRWLKTGSLK